jgi:alginate O-acetyltransferase complex protein AlgI
MLFNSYAFLFLFLPAVLLAFHLAPAGPPRIAVLIGASAVFYAMWDGAFLLMLLASILCNYGMGGLIARAVAAGRDRAAGRVLALAVAANLGLLGLFKYAGFALANLNLVLDTGLSGTGLVLPLGISFYTFEQIGFLVDLRRGAGYRRTLPRYALFVMFFPRLVAGPILRYGEVVPQFDRFGARGRDEAWSDCAVGLTLFAIGLAKKALLADGVAEHVGAPFALAAAGGRPDLFAAWGGALAYTAQLYFDFSGYSDMAIGLARLFGVRFPANFDSPYKAGSIVSFWRRWHMTLSRFLRDYLYIPLGGNRCGAMRQRLNLMLTMLLGGLWHGAAWTFVVWGGLHGLYLVVNHLWSGTAVAARARASPPLRLAGWAATFLAVVVGWVFFRAADLGAARAMLAGMAGAHGAAMPREVLHGLGGAGRLLAALGVAAAGSGRAFVSTYAWSLGLLALAWLAPNSQQILAAFAPTLEPPRDGPAPVLWRPTPAWGLAAGAVAALGVLSLTREGEFLYWQF